MLEKLRNVLSEDETVSISTDVFLRDKTGTKKADVIFRVMESLGLKEGVVRRVSNCNSWVVKFVIKEGNLKEEIGFFFDASETNLSSVEEPQNLEVSA